MSNGGKMMMDLQEVGGARGGHHTCGRVRSPLVLESKGILSKQNQNLSNDSQPAL